MDGSALAASHSAAIDLHPCGHYRGYVPVMAYTAADPSVVRMSKGETGIPDPALEEDARESSHSPMGSRYESKRKWTEAETYCGAVRQLVDWQVVVGYDRGP